VKYFPSAEANIPSLCVATISMIRARGHSIAVQLCNVLQRFRIASLYDLRSSRVSFEIKLLHSNSSESVAVVVVVEVLVVVVVVDDDDDDDDLIVVLLDVLPDACSSISYRKTKCQVLTEEITCNSFNLTGIINLSLRN